MTTWQKYRNADGEWAEVGAFILEASVNGSWVVRHKIGAVPCRASADMSAALDGGIEAAKAACERVLAEILAAPNGAGNLASTAALIEQKAITVALCRRYTSARAMEEEHQRLNALADLDRRVSEYLKKNT